MVDDQLSLDALALLEQRLRTGPEGSLSKPDVRALGAVLVVLGSALVALGPSLIAGLKARRMKMAAS